jgi:hypothetical protein
VILVANTTHVSSAFALCASVFVWTSYCEQQACRQLYHKTLVLTCLGLTHAVFHCYFCWGGTTYLLEISMMFTCCLILLINAIRCFADRLLLINTSRYYVYDSAALHRIPLSWCMHLSISPNVGIHLWDTFICLQHVFSMHMLFDLWCYVRAVTKWCDLSPFRSSARSSVRLSVEATSPCVQQFCVCLAQLHCVHHKLL